MPLLRNVTRNTITGASKLAEFKAIADEIARQECRSYDHTQTLSFRWEGPDPINDRDTEHFQDLLELLGLPEAEEYVLSTSEPLPGFEVSRRIMKMVSDAFAAGGSSLFMIHYTGLSMENEDKDIYFISSKEGNGFNVENAFFRPVCDQSFVTTSPIDVVFIFDSFYSTSTTRRLKLNSRVVEVVGAAAPPLPPVEMTDHRPSVTGRLVNKICKLSQQHIEFAELAQTIRSAYVSALKKPVHNTLVGVNSVQLPVPDTTGCHEVPPRPNSYVLFSVHITDDLGDEERDAFARWTYSLPENIALSLERDYRMRHVPPGDYDNLGVTTLILEATYSFFSKIANHTFVTYICECRRPEPIYFDYF